MPPWRPVRHSWRATLSKTNDMAVRPRPGALRRRVALGMCALLVAVGVSSGTLSRIPRAGVWMLRVKKVFAFVMLGVAEYYLIKMGQLII